MSLAVDIINGKYDEELDTIQEAVRQRIRLNRSTEALTNMVEIKIGDTVRFLNIRPKYMVGQEAVVVGKKVSKLVVRLKQPTGRFNGDTTVPASCVELVQKGD